MDSMPLNAESRITKDAVMTEIPMTEMRVIQLMTLLFFLVRRYLLAMYADTLMGFIF
jgi:hypothetical protein